jgi:hypothetical protein
MHWPGRIVAISMRLSKTAWLRSGSTLLWAVTLIVGSVAMLNYENAPGQDERAPAHWSAENRIQRDSNCPMLIMFAHPRCPCTRASIGELALIMARCQGRVTAKVIFFKPRGFPEDWAETDVWRSAAAIPGVNVSCDDGGVEARRFHAETSGYTVLYDEQGRLLFSGGITVARGHSGDNNGRSAIVALLNGGTPIQAATPIFGCSLNDPETEPQTRLALCQ